MPLGTAILDGRLLGDPGLGATTLTPTTRRAAITMRTMDSFWRIAATGLLGPNTLGRCDRLHIGSKIQKLCERVVRRTPKRAGLPCPYIGPRGTSRVGLFAFRFTPQAVVRQPRRLTKLGASSPNLPIRHGTYRSAPRFKYTHNFGWQRQQELQLWFGSLH